MSNPHTGDTKRIIKKALGKDPELSAAYSALAQAQATLALAYEARTANLIAALNAGFLLGHEHEDEAWADEIMPRLGLGDTK